MDADFDEKKTLSKRLRKLERENMWIKRIGIGVAALLTVLVLILHRANHEEVTAEHFILQDSRGRTRAELAFLPEGPGLEIYAASGEPRAQLIGGGEEASLNLYIPVTAAKPSGASVNFFREKTLMSSFRASPAAAALDLHSADGTGGATISIQAGTAAFTVNGAGEEAPLVSIEADANHSCAAVSNAAKASASGSLCVDSPGLPALKIADQGGDRAVLGVTHQVNQRTGKPRETSAASLVLEQKGGNVLWSAPR